MPKTEWLFLEEGLEHDTGRGHPECAARLAALRHAFREAGLPEPTLAAREATREELLRVHTAEYLDEIAAYCASGARHPDPDVVVSPGSWRAALMAAGGAIEACRAVWERRIDRAFCAVRPPGHHAEADRAMGFCLLNNVAIAARWLRVEAGAKRVAILDWDVHHGNGTQHTFYNDDTVLYVSMHEHPLYPGTGHIHERGKNDSNINLPMPPGAGEAEWLAMLERKALPKIEAFAPEILLISCGFDAHARDPLAHQQLQAESYARMTELVRGVAGGRIVSLLEGGYNLDALGASAVAHFRALST